MDGVSQLHAYDIASGKELWNQQLGTLQKAPPVLADGKLYVGTESGKFFIVRRADNGAEILSEVSCRSAPTASADPKARRNRCLAGAAISRGRMFFVSSDAVYAFGSRTPVR